MSPALQKLRKDLDRARSRHSKPAAADAPVGPAGVVGFDVIEMLFTALAAQDAEIRRLKASGSISQSSDVVPAPSDSSAAPEAAHVDSYVGHSDAPEHPVVYSPRSSRPSQG